MLHGLLRSSASASQLCLIACDAYETCSVDPILVRTSDGMTPTDRALELQPLVRNVLSAAEQADFAED